MSHFENREISWLKFNERVLKQALDKNTPLLERLRFMAIYGSNLDEFFRVRVGSLLDQSLLERYLDNDEHHHQVLKIMDWLNDFEPQVQYTYRHLQEEFKQIGLSFVDIKNLEKKDDKKLKEIWENNVKPFIFPQILRGDHPFPFLQNGQLYLILTLQTKQKKLRYGLISLHHLPAHFHYFVDSMHCVVSSIDVIELYIEEIYNKYKIHEAVAIRVTRNADIDVEISLIDDDVDYRGQMEDLVVNRQSLGPVRLQLDRMISKNFESYLRTKIECAKELTVINQYKLDLSVGFELYNELKDEFKAVVYPEKVSIQQFDFSAQRFMDSLKTRDYLVAYPYHSSNSFVQLLHEAALDPLVETIKISLYRLANPSRIVSALLYAKEKGKAVTVCLELRARFDEERNIEYSKIFEEAGCEVIYGIPNYKVHAKVCVIQMKDDRYITYIGTGNFNEKTQRQYTDLALVTTEQAVGEDAMLLFENLSDNTFVTKTQSLWIAPHLYRDLIIKEIDEEISFGRQGHIVMKMNSFNDELIMNKLIEASQAGVKVDLLVRGICCLVAGIEGISENITVKSIVGRYLEHSRIYKFGNASLARYYIGSGDLLHRNTTRRIEVFAKIKQQDLKSMIEKILSVEMDERTEGHYLLADGQYLKNMQSHLKHSQDVLYDYFRDKLK